MAKKTSKKVVVKTGIKLLAIDPGLTGAFLMIDGGTVTTDVMPIKVMGKDREICFESVRDILEKYKPDHIYLERAMPMAMGSRHAFNYGRGFAALEIAIQLLGYPVTYVEPQKWAKEMHEGISADLKPKAKSQIAAARLYPQWYRSLPKNKKGIALDGFVDALLIAGYGLRKIDRNYEHSSNTSDVGDFF